MWNKPESVKRKQEIKKKQPERLHEMEIYMEFRYYLKEQWKLHPSTQPQDVIKHCYQAAFGAEHLLLNLDKAKAYFSKEYQTVSTRPELPLSEPVSDEFCRINLAAWKAGKHDPKQLFELFAASVCTPDDSGSRETVFLKYLSEAETLVCAKEAPFTKKEWNDFCSAYQKSGMPPVHHSEVYRLAEHPAYRLVRREFL